ncbi:hypothetical protein RCL1_007494 [Eukaryota sp. TZLM3-RCL]
MVSISFSELRPSNPYNTCDSTPIVFEDSKGSFLCLKKVENSLASDRFCFLTTLKHPCLLNYYHLTDQQNGEIAEEYCPFGSLSDLIQAQHKFSANDLWCILTQLVYLFDFLLNTRLHLIEFPMSNIFVSSLNPLRIKITLVHESKSLVSPYGCLGTPLVSEFISWRDQLPELERIYSHCLSTFLNTIIQQLFPESSLLYERIPFDLSGEETLLKRLIDLVTEERILSQLKKDNTVLSRVFIHFPELLPHRIEFKIPLSMPNSLLFHVIVQELSKFKQPLLELNYLLDSLCFPNNEFLNFATKFINVSIAFRRLFLDAFNYKLDSATISLFDTHLDPEFVCETSCLIVSDSVEMNDLRNGSVVCDQWLRNFSDKFLSTMIITDTFSVDISKLHLKNVAKLELYCPHGDLNLLPHLFPTLKSLSIELTEMVPQSLSILRHCPHVTCLRLFSDNYGYPEVQDISFLNSLYNLTSLYIDDVKLFHIAPISSLHQLKVLSLTNVLVSDLSLFSNLSELVALSLCGTQVFDLWPLRFLYRLFTLDLRDTFVPNANRIVVSGYVEVKNTVEWCQHLHLEFQYHDVIDLSICLEPCRVKSLNLTGSVVENFALVSQFTNLETLNLTGVELNGCDYIPLSDVSFLSTCVHLNSLVLNECEVQDFAPLSSLIELTSLSLCRTRVSDLSPLRELKQLNYLDLRETLLSKLSQKIVSSREEVVFLWQYLFP